MAYFILFSYVVQLLISVLLLLIISDKLSDHCILHTPHTVEIKWYLNSPNDLMKERITRLLPWVSGNLDFNQKQKSVKVIHTLDFLPAELGPRKADDL